jgi:SOS regulatory protein LexA
MEVVVNDTDYLGKLQDYYAKHRLLPSFAVISELLGLKSKGSVAAMAKRLQERGYIESGPSGRLAPGKRFFEREIVDSVRAGLPHAATDVALGKLSIDEHLIRNPSKSLLLKVKGDSMVDAGLMEGDVVVVQRGSPAKTGDIVVAIVDNEFTIKYLELDDKGEFYLRPGNKAYPPVRPREQLEVFGKVVGSFRSYG